MYLSWTFFGCDSVFVCSLNLRPFLWIHIYIDGGIQIQICGMFHPGTLGHLSLHPNHFPSHVYIVRNYIIQATLEVSTSLALSHSLALYLSLSPQPVADF